VALVLPVYTAVEVVAALWVAELPVAVAYKEVSVVVHSNPIDCFCFGQKSA